MLSVLSQLQSIFSQSTVWIKRSASTFCFSFLTEDFRSIPSAQLTLEQFHTNDAEIEFDPPSYIRNVVQDSLNSQYSCLKDEQEGDYFTHESRAKVPRTVHLALPSSSDGFVTQGNGAQSSVSALVAAAHMQLGRSAESSGASNNKGAKDKSGCNTTSGESSDEGSVHDSAGTF